MRSDGDREITSAENEQTVVVSSSEASGGWFLAFVMILIAVSLLSWAWSAHHKHAQAVVKPITRSQGITLQPGDKAAKVGEQIVIGGLKLTTNTFAVMTNSQEAANGASGRTKQYLVATVTLEGNNSAQTNYSAAQFSVLTDRGTNAALTADLPLGIDKPLATGSIKNGQKVTGTLVLPLPAGFKYYYLVYIPKAGVHDRAVVGQQ